MKNADDIVVMITCSSEEEAEKIKGELLGRKKVACVNVVTGVNSFFWWKNKIDSSHEILLLAKTKKRMFKEVVTLVKKVHKYEVPEIVGLPIVCGNEDYLKWIGDSVADG